MLCNISNENVTLWLNAISAITQTILVIFANKALGQIQQQQKQNELTRETVAIDVLRDFVKFILNYAELNILIKNKNTKKINLTYSEMIDFNLSESVKSEFKENIANWHKFYNENPDIFSNATSCANNLEVIATALEYGTAKLEVIEDSISSTFCQFVENNAYIYIINRNDALNLYKNTIKLYKKLKPKVRSIAEQVTLIKNEVSKIKPNN